MSGISGIGPRPVGAAESGSGAHPALDAGALRSPTIIALQGISDGTAPALARGANGMNVRQAQAALQVIGYTVGGGVDGVFGRGTETTLLQFQRDNGITATGKIDRDTVRALDVKLWPKIVAAREAAGGGASGSGAGATGAPGAGTGRPVIGGAAPGVGASPGGVRDDSPANLKEMRDLLKFMFHRDAPADLGGKTLGTVLADAEGGAGAPNGSLEEADIDRLPWLSQENRTLLRNAIRAGGPIPYMDRAARDLMACEPDPRIRRTLVAYDRDEVPGGRGNGSVKAQDILDARRAGAIPAEAANRLVGTALYTPREQRPRYLPTTLPAVAPTTLRNDAGNLTFTPRAAYRPTNIDQLANVMRFAEENGRRLKPIGSLHSFSKAALADDIVLLPQGLSYVRSPAQLAAEGDLKRGEVDPVRDKLVRVGSGTQLRTLSPTLWDMGYALPNMGGYDEQTVAGVVNTATHGSGLAFSSFADIVRSMDTVLPGGRKVRIEPTGGITDPVEFRAKHPDMDLIQDDTFFNSAVMGMGSMGVVSSYVLGVRNKFYLNEKRTETTWEDAKKDLLAGGVERLMSSPTRPEVPGQRFPARHFEIIVNPYATNGSHTAIVTTRKDAAEPRAASGISENNRNVVYRMFNPAYTRPWLGEAILDVAPDLVGTTSRDLIKAHPDAAPGMIDSSIKTLTDDVYIERSYNVFNIGAANEVPAISAEIAVPIRGDNWIKAVDALNAKARELAGEGKYHNAPYSIRFVKQSRATLAPQQEDVAMFEIIFMRDSPSVETMPKAYEDALAPYGGKAHWGQLNFTTPETARARYGAKLDEWMGVRSALDPKGTLRNRFTDETLGVR